MRRRCNIETVAQRRKRHSAIFWPEKTVVRCMAQGPPESCASEHGSISSKQWRPTCLIVQLSILLMAEPVDQGVAEEAYFFILSTARSRQSNSAAHVWIYPRHAVWTLW